MGVHLDARLILSKNGSHKLARRQVDCRGIQRVYRIAQIYTEILPYSPIPVFVGIGESRFCNPFCETNMIKGIGLGVEAGCDIAQSVPGSDLRENHASKLRAASIMSDREGGAVMLYDALACLVVNQFENFGENEAVGFMAANCCKDRHGFQIRHILF
jgi:hypothetical protein